MREPTEIQYLVWDFHDRSGTWPMWLSVVTAVASERGQTEEETEAEIVQAVRSGELFPYLDQDHADEPYWAVALDPAAQDAIALWHARHVKEEA